MATRCLWNVSTSCKRRWALQRSTSTKAPCCNCQADMYPCLVVRLCLSAALVALLDGLASLMQVKRLSVALGYRILEASRLSQKNVDLAEANMRLMEETKSLAAEATSLRARLQSSAEETTDALTLASQVSDTLAGLTEDYAKLQDAHRFLADR